MIENPAMCIEPQKFYHLTLCASVYVTIIPILIVPILVNWCCTPDIISPLSIWSAGVICFYTVIEREYTRSSFCSDTTWNCNCCKVLNIECVWDIAFITMVGLCSADLECKWAKKIYGSQIWVTSGIPLRSTTYFKLRTSRVCVHWHFTVPLYTTLFSRRLQKLRKGTNK